MKKVILFIAIICSYENIFAQTNKKLLGVCNRDSLLQAPWKTWFEPNHANYIPGADIINKLKTSLTKDYSFEVFFGTWCGDSQRELPRFFKILDEANFSPSKVKLVAVDTGEAYKQSPGGETIGKGIYRVATFIVLKNGVEVGRVTQHPVTILEEDIYKIVAGIEYEPNFRAFKYIEQWLKDDLMLNANISLRGLAKKLKPLLISPSELSSCAIVLAAQNRLKEAIFICRMNSYIFYDSPDTYVVLARLLSKNGEHKEALENIEYAIKINGNAEDMPYLLNNYFNIRTVADKN